MWKMKIASPSSGKNITAAQARKGMTWMKIPRTIQRTNLRHEQHQPVLRVPLHFRVVLLGDQRNQGERAQVREGQHQPPVLTRASRRHPGGRRRRCIGRGCRGGGTFGSLICGALLSNDHRPCITVSLYKGGLPDKNVTAATRSPVMLYFSDRHDSAATPSSASASRRVSRRSSWTASTSRAAAPYSSVSSSISGGRRRRLTAPPTFS